MIIKRSFYNINTLQVAQKLLGCFLVRKYRGKITRAKIIETEAYRGERDLASHASKGRTKRTEIMYGQPGHAYVYLVYGMHHMLNIVTEERNFPAAVLIRSAIIIQNSKFEIQNLIVDGPGKLTKLLRIDKTLDGHDLTAGKKLWLEPAKLQMGKKIKIKKSPRIGVDYARHCKNWQWNFRIDYKA